MASLAPLESALVGRRTVWEAGCSVPSAVATTLSDTPVSCMPSLELTNVFDAPESTIACVMASSMAFASSCFEALSSFLRSSRRAQRRESLEMGRGPSADATINWVASVFGGRSLGGGGSSPEATR